MPTPARLGVDFGTSHTVAVLRRADGSTAPLLFDGSPLLPSAVFADGTGRLLTGLDAVHSARMDPVRFEPNPKRRVDDGTLLLGDDEYPIIDVFAAVLSRVRSECERVNGGPPASVTLTHPAAWGPARRHVLEDAAAAAGFGGAKFVAEPVAAATYFARVLGEDVPDGRAVVVYDFGGGTFDASVVARVGDGFEVLAVDGTPDLGGVDVDHALIEHLGRQFGGDPGWAALLNPDTTARRRHWRAFREDVRTAKERLSRNVQVDIPVPVLDVDTHVTRAELDEVTRPLLDKAVRITQAVIRAAGLPRERIAGVFLVGGASRMPLAATMLHTATGFAPIVIEQPELVVAQGATYGDDADGAGTGARVGAEGSAVASGDAPVPRPGSSSDEAAMVQPFTGTTAPAPRAGGAAAVPAEVADALGAWPSATTDLAAAGSASSGSGDARARLGPGSSAKPEPVEPKRPTIAIVLMCVQAVLGIAATIASTAVMFSAPTEIQQSEYIEIAYEFGVYEYMRLGAVPVFGAIHLLTVIAATQLTRPDPRAWRFARRMLLISAPFTIVSPTLLPGTDAGIESLNLAKSLLSLGLVVMCVLLLHEPSARLWYFPDTDPAEAAELGARRTGLVQTVMSLIAAVLLGTTGFALLYALLNGLFWHELPVESEINTSTDQVVDTFATPDRLSWVFTAMLVVALAVFTVALRVSRRLDRRDSRSRLAAQWVLCALPVVGFLTPPVSHLSSADIPDLFDSRLYLAVFLAVAATVCLQLLHSQPVRDRFGVPAWLSGYRSR